MARGEDNPQSLLADILLERVGHGLRHIAVHDGGVLVDADRLAILRVREEPRQLCAVSLAVREDIERSDPCRDAGQPYGAEDVRSLLRLQIVEVANHRLGVVEVRLLTAAERAEDDRLAAARGSDDEADVPVAHGVQSEVAWDLHHIPLASVEVVSLLYVVDVRVPMDGTR